MPSTTGVEIPPAEQARMRAEVRRPRSGDLLALRLRLPCAAGRTPSASAAVLLCSRSSVSRVVRAYQVGTLTVDGPAAGATSRARVKGLPPRSPRSLSAIRTAVPRACGGWRTRWRCAT